MDYLDDMIDMFSKDGCEMVDILFDRFLKKYYADIDVSNERMTINLTEEDIRKRFPLTYDEVRLQAKEKYSDFKQNKDFNKLMRKIKTNDKLYHERKLEPENPKSLKKPWYSSNIWQVLDEHYTRKNDK